MGLCQKKNYGLMNEQHQFPECIELPYLNKLEWKDGSLSKELRSDERTSVQQVKTTCSTLAASVPAPKLPNDSFKQDGEFQPRKLPNDSFKQDGEFQHRNNVNLVKS